MWTLNWSWSAVAPSLGRADVRSVSDRLAGVRDHDGGGGDDGDVDGVRGDDGDDDPDDVAPAVELEPEPDRLRLSGSGLDARPE